MNIQFDLGYLTAFQLQQEPKPAKQDLQEHLIQRSARNFTSCFQQFINIFKHNQITLQSKPQQLQIHDFDRPLYEVTLQASRTNFPRSMPPPQAKSMTKWEQFAKQKGIKRKKGKLVYDQISDKWLPRWGGRSLKKEIKKREGIVQGKEGVDVFEQKGKQRRLKMDKQKVRQLKNKQSK